MADIRSITLSGRLGADPELKYTADGTAVAQFRMAVNRWDGKQKAEVADWWSVTVFGKTAEFVGQHFARGSGILVVGEPEVHQWDDRETGQKRERVQIIARQVCFPPKSGEKSTAEPAAAPGATSRTAEQSAPNGDDPFGDQ
jgi:single-strand DNA-binding protein